MGTACGISKKSSPTSQEGTLPQRKVEYHTQLTVAEMKKAAIGPFFEELELNRGEKEVERTRKWSALLNCFPNEDFPVEAAICDPGQREKARKRLIKGVPQQFRWEVWTALRNLSFRINESAYEELGRSPAEVEVLIRADASCVFPDETFYQWATGREMLSRVLSKYCHLHPSILYSVDLAFISGFMLLVSGGREVEVYYMLENLLESFSGLFTDNRPYLKQSTAIFLQLVDRKLPAIAETMRLACVPQEIWVGKWMKSLFTAATPLAVTTRIWDLLLADGSVSLFQAGLTLVRSIHSELAGKSRREITNTLENLQKRQFRVEEFVRQVCKSKLRTAHLRQFERKYAKSQREELGFLSEQRDDSEENKERPGSPSVSTVLFESQSTSPGKSQAPNLLSISRSFREMEDSSGEDCERERKQVRARDVLESLLCDPASSSLSLESLCNLPSPLDRE